MDFIYMPPHLSTRTVKVLQDLKESNLINNDNIAYDCNEHKYDTITTKLSHKDSKRNQLKKKSKRKRTRHKNNTKTKEKRRKRNKIKETNKNDSNVTGKKSKKLKKKKQDRSGSIEIVRIRECSFVLF